MFTRFFAPARRREAMFCLLTLVCLVPAHAQSASGPVYVFRTSLGDISVRLRPDVAPKTVANFLRYVNRGDYDGSFIHRSVPNFVIQGGGYKFVSNQVQTIPNDPPIAIEDSLSNVRGTLAMARVGTDLNSATSQWFFSESNVNTASLDSQRYTVFGQIVDNAGLAVLDALAAVPTTNAGSPFDQLPVINYSGGAVLGSNLVVLYSVTPLPVTTAKLTGTLGSGGAYLNSVTVTLSVANAPASGGLTTFYSLDGGSAQTYAAPFTVSSNGSHTLVFHSEVRNGAVEAAQSVAFKIDALSFTLAPASVYGGENSTGTVRLSSPAPAGGLSVSLSSNTGYAVVPPSVRVPAGATSQSFTVVSKPVPAGKAATLTATSGGVAKTATLLIYSPVLKYLTLSPTTVKGGQQNSVGTVTLTSAAPPGGTVVSLSSNTGYALVPVSVTVPAGGRTASFTVTTRPVTSYKGATITAAQGGVSKSVGLLLTP